MVKFYNVNYNRNLFSAVAGNEKINSIITAPNILNFYKDVTKYIIL